MASTPGAPLPAATVNLYSPESGIRRAAANPQGHYSFEDVPPGAFTLWAEKEGFVPQVYGQRLPFEPSRLVNVSKGNHAAGINFALSVGGTIEGVVRTSSGVGVSDVVVTAIRLLKTGTLLGLQAELENVPLRVGHQVVRTDKFGRYRLTGVAPSLYKVAANLINRSAERSQIGILPVYFARDRRNPNSGDGVRVRNGSVTEADVVVTPVPLFVLRGQVIDSRRRAIVDGIVRLLRHTSDSNVEFVPGGVTGTDATGHFSFGSVPVGSYEIVAQTSSPWFRPGVQRDVQLGRVPVRVARGGSERLIIVVEPGHTIEGFVSAADGSPLMDKLRVQVRPLDYIAGMILGSTAIGANGDFVLKNAFGQYVLEVSGPSGPLPIRNQPIVSSGPRTAYNVASPGIKRAVHLVVGHDAAVVTGMVTRADGRAAADCVVLLYSTDQSRWQGSTAGFVARSRCDADGSFLVGGLVAGGYHVVAVDSVRVDQASDPAILKAFTPHALKISLSSHTRHTVSLPLIPSDLSRSLTQPDGT